MHNFSNNNLCNETITLYKSFLSVAVIFYCALLKIIHKTLIIFVSIHLFSFLFFKQMSSNFKSNENIQFVANFY